MEIVGSKVLFFALDYGKGDCILQIIANFAPLKRLLLTKCAVEFDKQHTHKSKRIGFVL